MMELLGINPNKFGRQMEEDDAEDKDDRQHQHNHRVPSHCVSLCAEGRGMRD